ncbi:5-formyltetrahydrofolate cyclo-ligase [Oscillospiraceae bacterium WX1]
MTNEKAAWRKEIAEKIGALTDDYIAQSDTGVFQNIIAMAEYKTAQSIFVYYSLGREVGTHQIIEHALAQGKAVALPVCFPGGIMEARAIKSIDELTLSRYKLMEPLSSTQIISPEALDFIIVPALSFDRYGFRLGWGGGYYDRFLVKTKGFTAGIARESLLSDVLPHEVHDIPVRRVVTEKSETP